MVFNVQENAVFIQEFSKISLPWEGGNGGNLLRSFALAPVEKSWLHHRHWHS